MREEREGGGGERERKGKGGIDRAGVPHLLPPFAPPSPLTVVHATVMEAGGRPKGGGIVEYETPEEAAAGIPDDEAEADSPAEVAEDPQPVSD